MGKKIAVTAAVALVGVMAMTGCSSNAPATAGGSKGATSTTDMDELVSAAKSEGSLTLYSDGTLNTQQAWTDAFTKEYDIPVSIVRDSGAPLYQRFAQEEAAGQTQADVIGNVDPASLDDAVDNGWIAEYTPQDAALFPEEQSRPGYYYPYLNGFAHTLAYNPEHVSTEELEQIMADPLKAMEDEEFRDRVGVCPPQTAQLAQAFWYQQTDGEAKDDIGWAGLEKIAANTTVITDTATLSQNIVQGEIDFAFPVADSIVSGQLANDSDAPIRFVYPKDTVGGQFGMGVVAAAPHPNAARLFVEWAATPEANSLLAKLTGNSPLNGEATDSRSYLDADWFRPLDTDATWYQSAFSEDEDFLAAMSKEGDYLSQWNQVFGYSG